MIWQMVEGNAWCFSQYDHPGDPGLVGFAMDTWRGSSPWNMVDMAGKRSVDGLLPGRNDV